MPRINEVWIKGFVGDVPTVKYNKDKEITQAAVNIVTCRGINSKAESALIGETEKTTVRNLYYESVWVSSKDPEFIRKICLLKKYDIMLCKGVIRVAQVRKKCLCPLCGEAKRFHSTKTAVYPIYLEKHRGLSAERGISNIDEAPEYIQKEVFEDAADIIKNSVEVSNNITILGAVAKEPDLYNVEGKGTALSFPLAVMRSYFIAEDDMSIKVDFPYVKLYGKQAIEGKDTIHAGNILLMRGNLSTRRIVRRLPCEHCDVMIQVPDTVTEIVPRFVEYIREDVRKPPIRSKSGPLNPNYIGSEAEIDLRKQGMELDESAEGVAMTAETQGIVDALSKEPNSDLESQN